MFHPIVDAGTDVRPTRPIFHLEGGYDNENHSFIATDCGMYFRRHVKIPRFRLGLAQ
jgi:hypothetical protein